MEVKKMVVGVDDESDTRTYLYELLSSEGYEVTTAADAFEALKVIAKSKPDLVITDVRMPNMEGMELLTKIKNVSPETRVILLTAYGDCQQYLEAVGKGAEDLVLKPIKNKELVGIVRRIFEQISLTKPQK